MFSELEQRDDMYSLTRDGVRVENSGRRLSRLDRPHVFTDDQGGELLPASLIKAKKNKKIGGFKGKSMKLGVAHSHDDRHRYHVLEDMDERPQDLINRFKRAVKFFRDERRESRDR